MIVICSLIANMLLGQIHLPLGRQTTKAEDNQAIINNQCIHRNKFTISQRLTFYPFNKAVQVKLVSFKSYTVPNHIVYLEGDQKKTTSLPDSDTEVKFPFEKHKVNYLAFTELKILDKKQINKLTDIIYNVGDRAPNWIYDMGASCFDPRNAILFIDGKGKTFAYIIICFECERYELSSNKIRMGEICDGKFKILRNYFATVGIEYGVTKQNRRN